MMGISGESSRMIFVASSPLRLGIFISIRIKSGCSSSNMVTASMPSLARSRWYDFPNIALARM